LTKQIAIRDPARQLYIKMLRQLTRRSEHNFLTLIDLPHLQS
jgi:hypothetical protein